jgi:hypothetical protein
MPQRSNPRLVAFCLMSSDVSVPTGGSAKCT